MSNLEAISFTAIPTIMEVYEENKEFWVSMPLEEVKRAIVRPVLERFVRTGGDYCFLSKAERKKTNSFIKERCFFFLEDKWRNSNVH